MKCAEAAACTPAFVDGELTGAERESYERHIESCESCHAASRFQGRFKAAVRVHLGRRPVPAAFEQRLHLRLAEQPVAPRRWLSGWLTWQRLVPAAVALGVFALVIGTVRQRRSFVWEQARRTYQAELPMDVTGPDCGSIASWFRGRLDFPVHAPHMPGKVTCQGGRLVNVQDRPAAYLTYRDPGGHRVSVLVFDPDAAAIDAPERRVVNGREVFYRSGPGLSTAAYRDRGLGYVVTSDLDEDSLTQLVSASFHP